MAQTPLANFHIHFAGSVDCDLPVAAKNIPISGDGTGVLYTDGSATADVTQTAFVFSSTIHFDGRVGRHRRLRPAAPRKSVSPAETVSS